MPPRSGGSGGRADDMLIGSVVQGLQRLSFGASDKALECCVREGVCAGPLSPASRLA